MNDYSPLWFKTFLETIPSAQTEKEIVFLARWLPQPTHTTILDLCCGEGRHVRSLAGRRYRVTGLDRDERSIAIAQRDVPGAEFTVGDIRDVFSVPGSFDAILCLWQSFGYFNDATNADILRQIAEKLNERARFVLDIYHRGFFETHQGDRHVERDNRIIIEHKFMRGNRLSVELDYGNARDCFEWQLYSPDEIRELAARYGLKCLIACTEFDEVKPATSENPRMQIVFEKQ